MKYFLYRHIRLDKNEPFYIGIGTKEFRKTEFRKFNQEYKRAFSKMDRSLFWKRIVSRAKYEVEILFESDDYSFIKKKESEFIKLYGRSNVGLGPLCNLTDGGEGSNGWIPTDETRIRMSENSGIKGKFGKNHHLSIKIYVYNINGEFIGEFGGYRECSRKLNIDKGNITQVLTGKVQQCNNMIFFKDYKGQVINPIIISNKKIRSVSSFDKSGKLVKKYNSVSEAAKDVGSQTTNISKSCNESNRICKGYYWKYNP